MNKSDISKFRLKNHHLIGIRYKTVEEAVTALGAVQAQEYEGGLSTIALRVKDCTYADIEKAIEEKKILRTWPMRGTLHFVPAKDAKWMLKHLTPRIIQRTASIFRKNDLNEAIFARSAEILKKALYGGKLLTRSEMYLSLVNKGVATKGMRGVLILGQLAMEGLICFGNKKGKQQTFTLLDDWITDSNDYSKEEGLSLLAKRFFTSHGPSTVKDFAWWTGTTLEDATLALDSIKKDYEEEIIEGKSYYFVKPKATKEEESAHLLQGYDEYTIAYRDNSGVIIDAEYLKKFDEPNIFISMFIINGKIAGTWKKTINPHNVIIHTRPFYKLSEREIVLLKAAADEYGRFLGLPVVFI